jgi:hypothetical protein
MSDNRKTGRPRGSTAEARLVAEAALPRCPHCKSTDLEVIRVNRTLDCAGDHDGHPYDNITWKRMRCRGCGAFPVLKFYRFSGESGQKK